MSDSGSNVKISTPYRLHISGSICGKSNSNQMKKNYTSDSFGEKKLYSKENTKGSVKNLHFNLFLDQD